MTDTGLTILKPCPFCGNKAEYHSHANELGDDWLSWKVNHWISCEECGNQTCMHGDKDFAVGAWNLRSEYTEVKNDNK
jgi:hypothetical protein